MMEPQLVKKGQQEADLFGVLKRADRVPEQKNRAREPVEIIWEGGVRTEMLREIDGAIDFTHIKL